MDIFDELIYNFVDYISENENSRSKQCEIKPTDIEKEGAAIIWSKSQRQSVFVSEIKSDIISAYQKNYNSHILAISNTVITRSIIVERENRRLIFINKKIPLSHQPESIKSYTCNIVFSAVEFCFREEKSKLNEAECYENFERVYFCKKHGAGFLVEENVNKKFPNNKSDCLLDSEKLFEFLFSLCKP